MTTQQPAGDSQCIGTFDSHCALEISRHAAEARAEIEHARALVREADSRLMASFIALDQETHAQRKIVAALLNASTAAAAPAAPVIEALVHSDNEIERSIDAAVTAMQFEDLVVQLLHRVDGRLRELGMRATMIANASSALGGSQQPCTYCATVSRAFPKRSGETTACALAPRPLVGGDAELF